MQKPITVISEVIMNVHLVSGTDIAAFPVLDELLVDLVARSDIGLVLYSA